MKAERWAELAGTWPRAAGKAEQAEAPNWATRGSRRVGRARQGRPGRGRKKAGLARVGPEGEFLFFFFSNQIFIQFYFLHFHF